jgi:hypothetical protein
MNYKFNGVPQNLSYGQNVEVTVEPQPESAVLQLWRIDDQGHRQAMLNTDVATPASGKPSMQFKIPPKDHPQASRYHPGKYLLVANARSHGASEGTEFPVALA